MLGLVILFTARSSASTDRPTLLTPGAPSTAAALDPLETADDVDVADAISGNDLPDGADTPEGSGEGTTAVPGDAFLEEQLANDYILSRQREDHEVLAASTDHLRGELATMASDAAALEQRLAQLDHALTGQETRLVQITWEHDTLVNQRSAVFRAMAETTAGIEFLEDLLTQRAVAAYMVPAEGYRGELFQASDVTELETKMVLINSVAESDDAVLALLENERDVLLRQQTEVDRLAADVLAQIEAEEAAVAAISSNREEYEALQALLAERIVQHTDEYEALAASEAELRAIIDTREARFVAEAEERQRLRALCEQGSSSDGPDGGIDCSAVNEPPPPTSVQWPADGELSSAFGERWGRMHQGIDIAAPSGAPVWAAEDGLVYHSGWIPGYGNTVLIDHGGGMHTLYAHMRENLSVEGDRVLRGDTIGLIGSTGYSTGPHLHFEIQLDGAAVDPLTFLYGQ